MGVNVFSEKVTLITFFLGGLFVFMILGWESATVTRPVEREYPKRSLPVQNVAKTERNIRIDNNHSSSQTFDNTPSAKNGHPEPFSWLHGKQSWCVGQGEAGGILYVKIPKAASSTWAGVAQRIAHRTAYRQGLKSACKVESTHKAPTDNGFFETKKNYPASTFLWTALREPRKLAISKIFFHRKDEKTEVTDQRFFSSFPILRNFQLSFIYDKFRPFEPKATKKEAMMMIEYVMQMYDFIGITERMDESLVVMKLLYNLEIDDLLTPATKKSGAYYPRNGGCQKIYKGVASAAVEEFVNEDYEANSFDLILYKLVNERLDRTIEVLGSQRVKQEIAELRELRAAVMVSCQEEIKFPCNSAGQLQADNCYDVDWGCGYPCFDRFIDGNGK